MGYISEKLFTIECDNCKEIYCDEYSGFAYWLDKTSALESASNNGWIQEEENHYCNKCHSYNDDDEILIDLNRKNES